MTIRGNEHPIYIKSIKSLLSHLNYIRMNAKDLNESDMVPVADEIILLFENMLKKTKEDFEQMKKQFYGSCPTCGAALGPK